MDFFAAPTHLVLLLVVVLLFGSTKLPALARNLRKAREELNVPRTVVDRGEQDKTHEVPGDRET